MRYDGAPPQLDQHLRTSSTQPQSAACHTKSQRKSRIESAAADNKPTETRRGVRGEERRVRAHHLNAVYSTAQKQLMYGYQRRSTIYRASSGSFLSLTSFSGSGATSGTDASKSAGGTKVGNGGGLG